MATYTIKDRSSQLRIIAIVSLSIFMFSFDYSMLNISIPSIAKHFGVTIGMVAWLPLVYLLIVTSTLLGFGKLGDTKGLRRVFTIGLGVFIVGTILCSIAPSIRMLLTFRAIQSLGEAMFSPLGVAILTTFLPAGMRGRALGIMALAQGLGFMLGNITGGFITSHFIWRGIFLVNVPLAFLTIFLSLKYLPTDQPRTNDKGFDFAGAALLFFALSTFIFSLNSIGKTGFSDPLIFFCLLISVVSGALFLLQEKKAKYPILNVSYFKNRDFAFANLAALLVVSMLIGTSFAAPFMMEMVMGMSVFKSGIFLMLPSLMMLFISPVSGWMADRFGSRPLCIAGTAMECVGFGLLSFVDNNTSHLYLAFCLLLMGTGVGLFLAPNNRLVMAHAAVGNQGVASGVYKICINTGSVVGIASLSLIIVRVIKAEVLANHATMAGIKHNPGVIAGGFHTAFIFASVVCAIACLFAIFARDKIGEEDVVELPII